MPLYEYQCRKCGYSFEELRPMKDADKAMECPKCHSMKTERQFSTFAAGGCGPGAASRGFT
jgi:putative FmdB family regulatory protein